MSDRIYIIAEAGVNHNGNVDMARQLIDVAAAAGADAVKFQTFKADKVVSKHALKNEYQRRTTDEKESQLDMIRKLELNETDHRILIDHCHSKSIEFLSTPFDFESIDLLAHKFNLSRLKIPSGEITNGPYLLHVARTTKSIILSTGMSTLGEVETALGVLAYGYMHKDEDPSLDKFRDAYCSEAGQEILLKKVILLHCTTEYPAPFEEVNLRVLDTMRKAFGLPVGISDHTQGITVAIAAVALGASVVEKHFTLDRSLPGPDHRASLEPDALREMISCIRQVEKALGKPQKYPSPSELKNREITRRSLVAAKAIRQGEIFTEDNLAIKRPGNGTSPMMYWESIGEKAEQEYDIDDVI